MNKKNTKYLALAMVIIALVPLTYFFRFGIILKLPLSPKQEVWGQLGDFLGGVMNPLLSFITILLLLESLKYQNDANNSLTNQLIYSEKTEKTEIFENLFFNLIESQRNLYSNFKIKIFLDNSKPVELYTIEAVDKVETAFLIEIENGKSFDELSDLYQEIDSAYGIFDLLRIFCVTVSLVKEHLNDKDGFSKNERLFYYEKLINLTEFAHIRLLATAIQFEKSPTTKKLDDPDFKEICSKLKLNLFNVYELS